MRWLGIVGLLTVIGLIAFASSSAKSPNKEVSAAGGASGQTPSKLVISDSADAGTLDISYDQGTKYGFEVRHFDDTKDHDTNDDGSGNNGTAWEDWQHTYMNFVAGPGMDGIVFNQLDSDGYDNNNYQFGGYHNNYNSDNPGVATRIDGTVNVNYANVGLYNFGTIDKPDLRAVGAHVKISDICTGSLPGWANKHTKPYIMFSDNLYSGVVYGGIKSMNMEISFFPVDNPKDTISFDDGQSVLTFNSLNANQGNDGSASAEFAGLVGVNPESGVTATPTTLQFHQEDIQGTDYTAKTYYSGTNGNDFTDNLESPDFSKASVSFPLTGDSTTFKFGSVWGRAWTAFSSATVYPTAQSEPNKTVEPIKQYRSGDTFDNPTGAPAEFNQRYDNDLDSYDDGGKWDFDNPQQGHDADNPSSLNAGIPAKEDRFVTEGQEYYYYINQPTINLKTQGLIVPDGYTIQDTLPEGVEYESATLYNLDGEEIRGNRSEPFNNEPRQGSDGQLNFDLSDSAANAINELSRDSRYYGDSFTIRIKVKVTNTTSDSNNDVMDNQATSTFHYSEQDLTATSNTVRTKLYSPAYDLSFVKLGSDDAKLKDAKFELTQNGYNPEMEPQYATSDENGCVQFTGLLQEGDYTLTETDAPDGYKKIDAPVKIRVTEQNGKYYATETDSDGLFANLINGNITKDSTLTDKKIFTLTFQKYDENDKPLADAKFTITNEYGNDVSTATSDSDGQVHFEAELEPGNYKLTETSAPTGYGVSEPVEFTVSEDGNGNSVAKVTDDNSTTFTNLGYSNEITSDSVIQDFPAVNLSFKKVDIDGNPLQGAEFTLEEGIGGDVIDTATSDRNGQVTFSQNLTAGSYTLVETKAPAGYAKVDAVNVKVEEVGGKLVATAADDKTIGNLTRIAAHDIQIFRLNWAGDYVSEQGYYYDPDNNLLAKSRDTNEISEVSSPGSYAVKPQFDGSYKIDVTASFDKSVIPDFDGTDDSTYIITSTSTITDEAAPGHLTVHKADADTHNPIKGAKFTLYTDSSGETQIGNPVTTDDRGNAEFTDLTEGTTYYARETNAPVGYKLNDILKPVTAVGMDEDSDLETNTITDHVLPIKLILRKVDVNSGKALAGSQYKLTNTDSDGPNYTSVNEDNDTDIDSTKNDPNLYFRYSDDKQTDGVLPGTYTLSETSAPNGYLKAPDVRVVVTVDAVMFYADDTHKPSDTYNLKVNSNGKQNINSEDKDLIVLTDTPAGILPSTGGTDMRRIITIAVIAAVAAAIFGVLALVQKRQEGQS